MSDSDHTYFKTRQEIEEEFIGVAPETGPISIQRASDLTGDYAKSILDGHNRSRPIPLTAKNNEPLEGFFFGYKKEDGSDNGLKDLLQNGTFVGFYLGIGEDIAKNSLTLVLYGVTAKNGDDLTLHVVKDQIYDFCDPCPPVCPI